MRKEAEVGQAEETMAARINDLRAKLLDAHARMIERDDEYRRTFDAALSLHTALRNERDALLEERRALRQTLDSAERRLNLFRSSPLGRAYRGLRRLMPRRCARF
jgi:hypothetical protein